MVQATADENESRICSGIQASGLPIRSKMQDFPNSLSFPIIKNNLENIDEFNSRFSTDLDTYSNGVNRSTSNFSISSVTRSHLNPNYLDCRLRYIRQTRRLQKVLRITPEGHLLVNDMLMRGQDKSNYRETNSQIFTSKSTNNPFAPLISTPKLKRIYAAFWNLDEDRQFHESSDAPNTTEASTNRVINQERFYVPNPISKEIHLDDSDINSHSILIDEKDNFANLQHSSKLEKR